MLNIAGQSLYCVHLAHCMLHHCLPPKVKFISPFLGVHWWLSLPLFKTSLSVSLLL
jgi:hypothetical protein